MFARPEQDNALALDPDELSTTLLALEQQLLTPETRHDESRLTSLLAEDFREFGSSGRTYTRAQIIALLASEDAAAFLATPQTVHDFEVHALSADVALVTYRLQKANPGGTGAGSLRSSVWVKRDDRWQVRFHQGTPIPQTG